MMRRRGRQGGAILIELAVFVIPAFLMLLVYAVFYGQVLYTYQVAQKAADHAARYLAGAPASNMSDPAQAANEVALARAIADVGLRDLQPGANRGPFIIVQCDNSDCVGIGLPSTVMVRVAIINHNDLLYDFAPEVTGGVMQVSSTRRYVGN